MANENPEQLLEPPAGITWPAFGEHWVLSSESGDAILCSFGAGACVAALRDETFSTMRRTMFSGAK
jgi:hypothetical protein